jgi:hypothetical protein
MMVDHSILNNSTYKFYKFCELMSMKQGSWRSFKQAKQHQKQGNWSQQVTMTMNKLATNPKL